MKKLTSVKILSIILLSFLLAACSFNKRGIDHNNHQTPEKKSSAELNRIKELAGRWQSTTSMFGVQDQVVFTEYSVTAGGSAVIEKIFPGTENEMISIYYDDSEGVLAMTHYCIMKNRPYFTLVESSKDSLKLDVTKVEGLVSKDEQSMGALTLNFEDKDHYSSTCGAGGKAGKDQPPMTMRFTRVN